MSKATREKKRQRLETKLQKIAVARALAPQQIASLGEKERAELSRLEAGRLARRAHVERSRTPRVVPGWMVKVIHRLWGRHPDGGSFLAHEILTSTEFQGLLPHVQEACLLMLMELSLPTAEHMHAGIQVTTERWLHGTYRCGTCGENALIVIPAVRVFFKLR